MKPQRRIETHKGVVGAWVAVALLALIGMAAAALDIGRLVLAVQHVQQVADAAALAGALDLPDVTTCQARLQDTVLANNIEAPVWPVTVDADSDVTYFGPGDQVPGFGMLLAGQNAIGVTGHADVEYSFATLFGIAGAHVARQAIALAIWHGGPGVGVLFAASTDPNVQGIRTSGSQLFVQGTIHSNTQVAMTGTSNTVTGDVEYRNGCRINDPTGISGHVMEGEVAPYPVSYTWDQFDTGPWDYEYSGNLRTDYMPPGRWRITGDLTLQGAGFRASDSLWLVAGDVRFLGSDPSLDRVTIVASGSVQFNGAAASLTPFLGNLAIMSLASGNRALVFDGANSNTRGVLFAPNGELVYNGAGQQVHSGALIALTIDVNGGGSTFRGLSEVGAEGGRNTVRLIR